VLEQINSDQIRELLRSANYTIANTDQNIHIP